MNEEQLKKVRDLLNQIKKLSRDTGFANPFSEDRRFVSDDTIRDITNVGEVFKELTSYIRVLQAELKTLDNEFVGIMSSINQTIGEITGSYTKEAETLIKRGLRGIRTISADLAAESEATIKLTVKQLEDLDKRLVKNIGLIESNQQYIESLSNEKEEIRRERERLEAKQKIFGLTDKEASALDKIQNRYESIRTLESVLAAERKGSEVGISSVIKQRISERKVEEDQVKKLSGLTGAIAKSTKDLLSTIGLASIADFLDIESIESRIDTKAREENEKITEAINKRATPSEQRKLKRSASLGIIGEGFKGVGKSISKVFTDIGTQIALVAKGILFIFNQIKDAFISVDAEAGKLAKTFNVTYQEALAIRNELVESARASNELFVTSKALQETLSQINLSVGTRSFTGLNEQVQQSVVFLTKLREQADLSAESLGRVAELSFVTGESAEDLTKTLLGSVEVFAAREGLILNEKQVFEEIQNLSDATLLSLSRTPSEIGKAVVEARKLGASLSQIEGISESLVNFQSSIESELQAQVLTGRALNLNAARLFALNNDTAGVAREISSQIGSAAEFADLNRIQQKGVADAIGVGRDELAKMLIVQEQIAGLQTDEAEKRQKVINSLIEQRGIEGALSAIGDGQLEKLEKQASVQEQFTASVNKLKEVFVDIATIIGPLLSGVAAIVGKIASLISSVEGSGEILGGAGLGAAIGTAFAPGIGTAIGGSIGAIGGLAATLVNDGYFPPMEGEEGYDRALLTPEGTFRINNSDNIIAGTDSSLRPRMPRTGYTTQITPITNVSNTTTQPISSQNVTNLKSTQAVDMSELVSTMKKSNELIEQQTRVLSQGQEAIRKQKQVLQVGATDFGTQLNTNSYSVQFG